ncbi:single-stranded DNA-binding protein [Streptomyces platensis]|uniref:single-stranded DNA-binding protein n=1 Tax=Streptomyces platensis TaxID=58346 RepID=UPI00386EF089|nr:single-stranded DNA-binding protein [Streptomyces platensis]
MVTLVGNAATAVEHRQTAAGVTVARFRMAATSRRWDRAQERWTDGETSFYTVRSWRGLADNVAASVAVGEPLIVQGRLRLREGEQPPEKGGQRWFSAEVDAVAIGHDLTRGTAAFRRVLRAVRTGADGPSGPSQQPSTAPGPSPAPAPSPPPGPLTAPEPSQPGQLAPAPQSPPAQHSSPASDSPSPPPPRPSPSPLSASVSPSPSSLSPQRSRPPHPAPPAQQDLWEGPLPEAGTRTTPKAPTAADSPTATSSPTNSPTNSPTDADPPTDAKARTAGEARPASRPRTGARGRRVLKEQRAAKGSTAAKTPATSGIAAGAGGSGDSAVSPSSVPHAPGKVTVP